jgi:hypothetical protein
VLTTSEITPEWLALREPADAAARAEKLLEPLLAYLPAGELVIRDLGCGIGANRRWLGPRLPGPQHWILHDLDAALLARAAADGEAETRLGDITALRASDLRGTSLVTASAVLDLLTAAEVDGLAEACAGAGVPVLFTLTVAGRVELEPPEPLVAQVEAAFNEHQRRVVGRRGRLLGPDAVAVAEQALAARGMTTHRGSSPWRLGPGEAALLGEWLRGWCAAAVEQRPELEVDEYLRRRLADAASRTLRAVVHHVDLLALPEPS